MRGEATYVLNYAGHNVYVWIYFREALNQPFKRVRKSVIHKDDLHDFLEAIKGYRSDLYEYGEE